MQRNKCRKQWGKKHQASQKLAFSKRTERNKMSPFLNSLALRIFWPSQIISICPYLFLRTDFITQRGKVHFM